jgi:hypothetical protein
MVRSSSLLSLLGQPTAGGQISSEEFDRLLHPDDVVQVHDCRERVIRSAQTECVTYRVVLSNGQVRHLKEVVEPDRDGSGAVVALLGVAQDITEYQEALEIKQRHLNELMRWQTNTVDREMRILELKHEVNELLRHQNKAIRYPSAEKAPGNLELIS